MGITLVSLTDTIATATSFAARRGDEVDPDHEMVGIGTSNIAAGFFQGFAVSLRGSRTAVADQSGARTQLTGLAGAGLVAVLLLFPNGLLADLPQTVLAAVVITAALSLIDLGAALLCQQRSVPGSGPEVRTRTDPAWIVLQCEVVTDMDVTAADVLKALDEELNERGVHLAFVEPRNRLQDLVRRHGLNTTLDRAHFYPSLDQALDAINNAAGDSPMPPDEGMPPP